MNISQRAWPFFLLILFLVVGLPSIDHLLKEQQKTEAVEVQLVPQKPVAVVP